MASSRCCIGSVVLVSRCAVSPSRTTLRALVVVCVALITGARAGPPPPAKQLETSQLRAGTAPNVCLSQRVRRA